MSFRPSFVALAIALCVAAPAAAQQKFVRIASGVTGTYAIFGAKVAETINRTYPDLRASTLSGPTEQNLVRVQRGEAELVLNYTFQSALTFTGKGELGVPTPDLRQVMSTYGSFYFPIIRPGSGIETPADLKKRASRVWMGPKSGAFYAINTAFLAAFDVSPEDIVKAGGVINSTGYQNLEQTYRDGQVDLAFFAGPVPYSMLMQLDRSPGFKIVDVPAAAAEKFIRGLPGMAVDRHPAAVYQSSPTETTIPYLFNQISTSARVSDDIVYRVTKLLNEDAASFHGLFPGATDLGPANALKHNRLPLHPGAERYYRETGALK